MKTNRLILFMLLIVQLLSCQDSESPTSPKILDSQYILINTAEANNRGNISVYNLETKDLTMNAFTLDVGSFIDVKQKDKHLYAATAGFGDSYLRKINTEDFSEIKKIKSTFDGSLDMLLDFHENEILMTGVYYDDDVDFLFIKVYDDNLNLIDSVAQESINRVYDVKVSGDKLFCSVRNNNFELSIQIFDLKSHEFLTPIGGLAETGQEFIKKNDTELLCLLNTKVIVIDTEMLAVKKTITHPVYSDATNQSCALDAAKNILYYLRANPQPSPVQFTIHGLDLATEESEAVTEFGVNVSAPIVYDERLELVVSGGKGIKVFSKDGELMGQADITTNTKRIFVKEP